MRESKPVTPRPCKLCGTLHTRCEHGRRRVRHYCSNACQCKAREKQQRHRKDSRYWVQRNSENVKARNVEQGRVPICNVCFWLQHARPADGSPCPGCGSVRREERIEQPIGRSSLAAFERC